MKKILASVIALSFTITTHSQEVKNISLLDADESWGKEIIEVPFWFAPQIKHKGFEDIRFAPGWEDTTAQGFWALAFAWDIDLYNKPDVNFFEESLKLYLDGLMKVVVDNDSISFPKAKVNLQTSLDTIVGRIDVYDAFTTNKVVKLNVRIEVFHCSSSDRYTPLFKMSPCGLGESIWSQLKEIRLNETVCIDLLKPANQ